MKRVSFITLAAFMVGFGLLTTFLSSSIIFDWFDIRSHEGNYVLIVVWANFVSGLLYLASAVGFIQKKVWAALPLIISVGILILAFFGLLIHINGGGAYETKTIFAMLFRILINVGLLILIYRSTKTTRGVTNPALILVLPVLLTLAACGHSTVHEHDHESEASGVHEHAHDAATHAALTLNGGEKWEADEHTMSAAQKMKHTVSDFEKDGRADYNVLAGTLETQLNGLIAGCTMEGAPHDALHQWLEPFLGQVKELSQVEGPTEGSAALQRIQESLDVFDEHFQ
jgi:hypothetical protein